MSQFSADIKAFNEMYGMPVNQLPTLISAQRLRDFKSILGKELDEIDEIIEDLAIYEIASAGEAERLAILTKLADLLGDLQVYCASEMAKWGLPRDMVLAVIMQSNFSKMGADGKPIYDGEGKLQKGPNYWKPEPKIHLALQMVSLRSLALAKAEEAAALGAAAEKMYEDIFPSASTEA